MLLGIWGVVQSGLYCFSHLILITVSESLENIIVFTDYGFHREELSARLPNIR